MNRKNELTVAGIGTYLGGITVAELVRQSRPSTFWDFVGLVAVVGGSAWIAQEVAGKPGLDLFAKGLNYKPGQASRFSQAARRRRQAKRTAQADQLVRPS